MMKFLNSIIPRNTGMPTKLRELKSLWYSYCGQQAGSIGWLIAKERQFSPRVEHGGKVLSKLDDRLDKYEQGGDKMAFERHAYAPFYSRELRRFTGRSITLVELGVFRGNGLALFAELFPPPSLIVGLDIEPARFTASIPTLKERGGFVNGIPKVYQFDAYAPDISVLERVLGGRSIDIFIDDGPHTTESIEIVARVVKPYLSERYLYVAEDNPEVAGLLGQTLGTSEIGNYRGLSYARS